MRRVYLIGSLRNPQVREAAARLRNIGHEVFDDWHGAGSRADLHWREYEQERGHTLTEALRGPLAISHFNLDKQYLDWCDTGVLLLPAGKSGHLELGYLIGKEARPVETHIILDGEPAEGWDLMYLLPTFVWDTLDELANYLELK